MLRTGVLAQGLLETAQLCFEVPALQAMENADAGLFRRLVGVGQLLVGHGREAFGKGDYFCGQAHDERSNLICQECGVSSRLFLECSKELLCG